MLIRKTLRDIRNQWAQFLSVFVMASLTMLVFVGITSAGYGMQLSLDDYNVSSAPADAWLTGKNITDADLEAMRGMDTVSQADAGITTSASIKDATTGHNRPSIELNAVDRADIPRLDHVKAPFSGPIGPRAWMMPASPGTSGWMPTWPATTDGSRATRSTLTIRGHDSRWCVQGLVHSFEYLYPADPDTSVPDHGRFGFAYTSMGSLQAPQSASSYSTVRLRLNESTSGDKNDRLRRLEDSLRTRLSDRFLGFSSRDSRQQTNSLQSRVDKIVKISALFSAIFALVALSTMLTSISRLVGSPELTDRWHEGPGNIKGHHPPSLWRLRTAGLRSGRCSGIRRGPVHHQ